MEVIARTLEKEAHRRKAAVDKSTELLKRCRPPTTIATLKAIRLFLFLENTAFVVVADDTMICALQRDLCCDRKAYRFSSDSKARSNLGLAWSLRRLALSERGYYRRRVNLTKDRKCRSG